MQAVLPNTLGMSIPVGNQNQVGDNHTKGLTLACRGYICKYFYILTNS